MEPIQKSVMLHQYNNCRENTAEDWVRTLSLGGIDCFRVKSHDGTDLMGAFYRHPLAPVSLDEIQRQYEAFGQHGIAFVPWCVPTGRDVPAEAALAVEVARRCDNRIDVDLETGQGFWNVPVVGNARIPEYFQRIKDAGIDIILDTALFEGWVDALRLAELAPYVRRILGQSYDVGFSQQRGHTVDYRELFRHDVAEMKRTGIGEYGIILDARAGRGIAERAAYAQSLGCVEVSCWEASFATPDTYAGFAAVPTKPFLEEAPPVSNDDLYRAMMHEAETISDLADVIGHNATPGSEGGDTSITDAEAVAAIREAADSIDAARLRVVDLASQVRV